MGIQTKRKTPLLLKRWESKQVQQIARKWGIQTVKGKTFKSLADTSIAQKGTEVNIEVAVDDQYNNLYDVWKDFYLSPNISGYYATIQFIVRGAKDVAASIEEILTGKTRNGVPTIVLKYNGKVVGKLYIIPPDVELSKTVRWSKEQKIEWCKAVIDMVEDMGDLTVDVLECVFSYWLQHKEHPEAFVEINVDDILEFRGLKKKVSGNGRKGGYRKEQREAVIKQLRLLARIYGEIQAEEYEKGKTKNVTIKSPLILIDSEKHFHDDGKVVVKVQPGELMRHALLQGKLALTPKKALQYNPFKHAKEKRLARFLSRQWRNNQKNGVGVAEFNTKKLLEEMGIDPLLCLEEHNLKRATKKRLEEALNNVCGKEFWKPGAGWKEADSFVGEKWLKEFLKAKVVVYAPDKIVDYYRDYIKEVPEPKLKKKEVSELGIKLDETIKRLGITRHAAAQEIGIDEITLYRIITGKTKNPVKDTRKKCEKWLEKVEEDEAVVFEVND